MQDTYAEPSVYDLQYLVYRLDLQRQYSLTDTETKVISFILSYSNISNRFYFSNESIGELFGKRVTTISTAISKLERLGLIETTVKIMSGGGKIRFVRLSENRKSDFQKIESKTFRKLKENNNKINNNKINNISPKKKENKYNREWLRSKEAVEELHTDLGSFFLTEKIVTQEVEKMIDWLESTGKRYKNYRAFARNWLRRWKDESAVKNQKKYSNAKEAEWNRIKESEVNKERQAREESIRSTAELLSRYE